MYTRHIHSFEGTGEVGCTRKAVGQVLQKGKHCLDHLIVSEERWRRSSLGLVLEAGQKAAIPAAKSIVRKKAQW